MKYLLVNEIWKDIEGYEGLYQISNGGRVKSLARKTNNQNCKEDKILAQVENQGYLRVHLCNKEHKKRYVRVNILVCYHFNKIPEYIKDIPIDELQVNHIDENKLNKLEKFYNLVIKQNEVMNLTNIIEKNEFAIKNILDSVLPINTFPQNSYISYLLSFLNFISAIIFSNILKHFYCRHKHCDEGFFARKL